MNSGPSQSFSHFVSHVFSRSKARSRTEKSTTSSAASQVDVLEQRILLSANVELENGVARLGQITSGETDSYTFQAQQGDRAFFTASPTFPSTTFTLQTTIYDPNNQIVYQSGNFSHDIELPILKTGTYRILFQDGGHDATGGYKVQVAVISPTGPLENFSALTESANQMPATIGAGEMDLYKFTMLSPGTARYIIADMSRTENASFHITILDSNRQTIYDQTKKTHELEFENLAAGEYAIVVRDDNADTQFGYFHTLIMLPGIHDYEVFDDPLVSNDTALNSIAAGDAGLNEFTINAGDKVFYTAAPFSLDEEGLLHVTIYGPDVRKVYDQVRRSHELQFDNLSAGTYTVVVTEDGGDVFGSYNQTFVRTPGPHDPSAAEGGLSLTLGNTKLHSLSSGDIDLFTFTATAGEAYRFQNWVDSPTTNFAPRVTIVGPNNQYVYDATATSHDIPLFNLLAGEYSIIIRDKDADVTGNVRSLLTTVEARPFSLSLSSQSIAENQIPGSLVGRLSTIHPVPNETFTYSLAAGNGDVNNSSFSIVGNELRTTASFNYEAKPSYSIRVRSTDHIGQTIENVFTITVTDLNERPSGLTLSNATVIENLPAGTLVGNLIGVDPDAGSTLTYSLVSGTGSGDNTAFTLVGNQLRTKTSFDFESKPSYSIRARVTDQTGLFFDKVIIISVIDRSTSVSIDFGNPGYHEYSGTWGTSATLAGHDGSVTRFSNSANAAVSWTPTTLIPGWYQVEVWNVAHASNASSVTVTVQTNQTVDQVTYKHNSTPNGWRSIGTYYFDGTANEVVRLAKSGSGYLRADAVRFTTVVTVNNEDGQPAYKEQSGSWSTSTAVAGNNGTPTRFSNSSTAATRWNLQLPDAGWYQVEIWNVAHATNTTQATVTVQHHGMSSVSTFNHATSPSGWRTIGTFYFEGGNEFVQLSKSGSGYLRADAIRVTASVPTVVTINNENGLPGYKEQTGTWANSTAVLGNNDTATRFSNSTNASVRWNASTLTMGWYQVELWNVAHGSNTSSALITVQHNGQTTTSNFNHATATAGWLTLGKFYFNGSASDFVQLSKNGSGYLRADAVRFTTTAAPTLLVHNEDMRGFSTPSGTWQTSGLAGVQGTSIYSSSSNAEALYQFMNLAAGWYQIETFIPAATNSTTLAKYTISSNSASSSVNIDQRPGGWITLGEYYLNSTAIISLTNLRTGLLRADAIRLVPKIKFT